MGVKTHTRTGKPDHELRDPHMEHPRGDEMPELMHDDEHRQHEHPSDYDEKGVHLMHLTVSVFDT